VSEFSYSLFIKLSYCRCLKQSAPVENCLISTLSSGVFNADDPYTGFLGPVYRVWDLCESDARSVCTVTDCVQ
jgi:hypothetical protein